MVVIAGLGISARRAGEPYRGRRSHLHRRRLRPPHRCVWPNGRPRHPASQHPSRSLVAIRRAPRPPTSMPRRPRMRSSPAPAEHRPDDRFRRCAGRREIRAAERPADSRAGGRRRPIVPLVTHGPLAVPLCGSRPLCSAATTTDRAPDQRTHPGAPHTRRDPLRRARRRTPVALEDPAAVAHDLADFLATTAVPRTLT